MKKFHQFHIEKIFSSWDEKTPFDLTFSRYAKEHHQLGSKDRKAISEACYQIIRWALLLDYEQEECSWLARVKRFFDVDVEILKQTPNLPLYIRCSTPEWIFSLLSNTYGEEKAEKICLAQNERAPFAIRANLLKTSTEELFSLFSRSYSVTKSVHAKQGLIFAKAPHLLSSDEYKHGLFEIQDEASQCVSAYVDAKEKQTILDYCAGSAGKSLAIASMTKDQCPIFVYDIRPQILIKAEERLKRAGVKNFKLSLPSSSVDIVLVDAPCSGSGTWRRSPERKLVFTKHDLEEIIKTQREVLKNAIQFVKPGGRLIYATCSIFNEENIEQVGWLMKNFPFTLEKPPFQSIVAEGEMDGFFAASLKREIMISS
ncbi:MAG: RsmB/NOP family class I SAM-dependent RNA methyltransferase [Chlamydiae bacterium]|nr:RsmB/NOP family class I SAM-dependent RNA methyltransferase [Chlamydiota bacterium]